jgi:hypothetical protein
MRKEKRKKDVEPVGNYRGSVKNSPCDFCGRTEFWSKVPRCCRCTSGASGFRRNNVSHEDHWLKTTSIKVESEIDDVEHVSGVP